MAQLHSWLNSSFKYLSNDTSHAQIQVQLKKLCHQQVGEEKQAAEHKLCHDKASNKARNFVGTNLDYVATKIEEKLCQKKVFF